MEELVKSVAVITRTKNRPLMLQRTLTSVANQTLTDFCWVIVNDGGEPEPVNQVVTSAKEKGLDVIVRHNQDSKGMQSASNIGLSISSSKYVVIHDDDDSWEPTFLQKTVEFLDNQPENSIIKGVVTRSMKIVEVIKENSISIKRRIPYTSHLSSITLFQMAHFALVPPPISFLYRRDVLKKIDFYREDISVLGDWEFYLRFLSRYDIAVLPEYLANYHWRETLMKGDYRNTVVADLDVHAYEAAFLKNDLLRKDLSEGKIGIGFLINLCHDFQVIQNQLNPWRKFLLLIRKTIRPFKYLYNLLISLG